MIFAKIYLPDVVLPFLFFEIWYVFLAFFFIVLIETLVVRLFLKENLVRLFKVLLKANFWTTIVGYIIQGLIRIFIGFIAIMSNLHSADNEIFNGLVGNVGLGSRKLTSQLDKSTLVALWTSIIIALSISIILERKILIRELNKDIRVRNITFSITIANVVSYCFLFIWIYFNYLRFQK
jgi:hypothetical protein